jgi:hypothetical protein
MEPETGASQRPRTYLEDSRNYWSKGAVSKRTSQPAERAGPSGRRRPAKSASRRGAWSDRSDLKRPLLDELVVCLLWGCRVFSQSAQYIIVFSYSAW